MITILRKTSCALILTSMFVLGGCATNADVGQMVANYQPAHKLKNAALHNNINVAAVNGGHETNPLWTSQIDNDGFKSALIQSLQQANLSSQLASAGYKLTANLVKLHQPLLGLNLTVTAQVHYNLQNQKTNKIVYDRDITSSYTATFKDSALAITRLKMANEGAARENISNLINDLYNLPAN